MLADEEVTPEQTPTLQTKQGCSSAIIAIERSVRVFIECLHDLEVQYFPNSPF